MKPGLHPNYVETTVSCACGSTFQTRSTRTNLKTDLCSVCHPFYTGEQRIIDTAGQVERFLKRVEGASASDGAPSKRQQRLQVRSDKLAEEQRRDEEEAKVLAAEESAARAVARAAAAAQAEANAAAQAKADAGFGVRSAPAVDESIVEEEAVPAE